MRRTLAMALLLSLPLLAGAQAIRCKDPVTGRTVYTDQPCKGGEVIVPARTEAERAADELAAEQARERAVDRQQQALYEQRMRLETARQEAAAQAAAAAVAPSQTAQCQRAMAEADFRARSNSSTEEQVRTARFNAALACGQAPPAEVVVVPQQPWGAVPYRPPHHRRPVNTNPTGAGWEAGRPGWVQQPAQPAIPVAPPARPPGVQRPNRPSPDDALPAAPYTPPQRSQPSSSGIRY